jgi:hypothetical protein
MMRKSISSTHEARERNEMYEVSPGIFLGNRLDVRNFAANTDPHAIVHASHTAHKLLLGYRNAAPRNAEYLVARRENHLFLNIITHHSASFYHAPLFTAAIAFIKEQRSLDRQVLIYSDQGGNRPAGIALVYLAHERLIPLDSFEGHTTQSNSGTRAVPCGVGWRTSSGNGMGM